MQGGRRAGGLPYPWIPFNITLMPSRHAQNLLELVANEMATEPCQADAALVAFHANTLKHLAVLKAKGGPRYDAIQL